MKFTCEREALLNTVTTANKGVVPRPERPILNCILLELADNKLTATATDQHLWVRASVQVSDGTDGAVAMPARHFVEALRSCDPGAVTFESAENKTTVESGRAKFVFNHLRADDYPQMQTSDFAETSVKAEDFLDALKQVVTARSTDEARTVLTSALFASEDENGNSLRLVCTDSYRLSLRDLQGFDLSTLEKDILVPGRALEEVSKLAGQVEEMTIGIGSQHIFFSAGDSYFMTQLIDGDYPKYKNLIPKQDDYPNCLCISGEGDSPEDQGQARLRKAIGQVRIMAGPDTPVKLKLEKEKLTLSTASDHGESVTELDVNYEGEEMTVAFNPKYLLEGVDACPGDDISIYLLDELKPAVLRGSPEEDFLYLLMPVRVAS